MMNPQPEPSEDGNESGASSLPEWWTNAQPVPSGTFSGSPDQQAKARMLRAEDEVDKYGFHRSPKAVHISYNDCKEWLWEV